MISLERRFFNLELSAKWAQPARWKLLRKVLEPCLVVRCESMFMENVLRYGLYHPDAPIVPDYEIVPEAQLVYAEDDEVIKWFFEIPRPGIETLIFGAAFILREHL